MSLCLHVSPSLCVFALQECHSCWIRTHLRASFYRNLFKGPVSKCSYILWLLLFGRSIVSDSLQPPELQHARLPCPSPSAGLSLLTLMCIESVMPSNHLILCRPLLLPSSIFPSIKVFSCELVLLIRWPKYSVSVLPVNFQG